MPDDTQSVHQNGRTRTVNKLVLTKFSDKKRTIQETKRLKSKKTEKFRYDKTVYIAAVGKCGTCYYCVNACPENAIKEWNPPTINHALCTRCMKCAEACPRDVLTVIR